MLLWGLVTTAADNAAAWEPERQTLRRELDIVGARAGLRNMLISVANACGVRARTERAAALSQQGPVDPEPVLRQVLELADRAESLMRSDGYGTSYEGPAVEIGRTVDGFYPATVEEAIAKLGELQR